MCSNASAGTLSCDVMTNLTFPHSLPLHVNLLDNALLQSLAGTEFAFINVVDSPLPFTDDELVSCRSLSFAVPASL